LKRDARKDFLPFVKWNKKKKGVGRGRGVVEGNLLKSNYRGGNKVAKKRSLGGKHRKKEKKGRGGGKGDTGKNNLDHKGGLGKSMVPVFASL